MVRGVNHSACGSCSSWGRPNYVESTIKVTKKNIRIRTTSKGGDQGEKRDTLFGVLAGGSVQDNVPELQLVTVIIDDKNSRGGV